MEKKRLPRLPDWIPVVTGLLVLLAGGVMAALGFGGTVSEWENRNLAAAPQAPDLTAWTTDKEAEEYLSPKLSFSGSRQLRSILESLKRDVVPWGAALGSVIS